MTKEKLLGIVSQKDLRYDLLSDFFSNLRQSPPFMKIKSLQNQSSAHDWKHLHDELRFYGSENVYTVTISLHEMCGGAKKQSSSVL